jgi:hypothetical protein
VTCLALIVTPGHCLMLPAAAAAAAAAVYSAATSCVLPQLLSTGIRTARAANLKWPGCSSIPNTEVRFFGERCGADLSKIRYTAMATIFKSGAVPKYQGKDCLQTLRPAPSQAAWNKQNFGSCGDMKGAGATDLPVTLCSATGGATRSCIARRKAAASGPGSVLSQTLNLKRAVTCGSESTRTLTYEGEACGPNGDLVLWTKATTPNGCVLTASKAPAMAMSTAELFGSCGVPPGLATAAVAVKACPTNPIDCKGVWSEFSECSVT